MFNILLNIVDTKCIIAIKSLHLHFVIIFHVEKSFKISRLILFCILVERRNQLQC